MMSDTLPVIVLGASGYVGGEFLRLVHGHPRLDLVAAVARRHAGTSVATLFPHLATAYPDTELVTTDTMAERLTPSVPHVLLAAAPHVDSAALIDGVLGLAAARDCPLTVIDTSADFRFRDQVRYQQIHGVEHGAPELLDRFTCALPELTPETPAGHIAHPGCFTTATVLATAPLIAGGLATGDIYVSAVTGSTGSGRSPSATTHHPERHGGLRAYKPLVHRHQPEMEELLGRLGDAVRVHFVPHSGPFARGIHVTVHARLRTPLTGTRLRARMGEFYASQPLVQVEDDPPRLKDVVGSHGCRLSAAVDGQHAVVMGVIDNLVRGAAGGALQWLNRKSGWPATLGLDTPAMGWN